jgi:peptide-methionine (S)-S-oxide reductase
LNLEKAVLAGGCFWGLEELFRQLPGVKNTEVGYCGGENPNPTYENHPGHAEAIEIEFDNREISFKEILDFFFRVHNPTTLNRQGNDVGTSYRSAIFMVDETQRQVAEEMIKIVNASGRWGAEVCTSLEPFQTFYPAEGYHQDYLQKHPQGYTCHAIRFDTFLED